MKKYNISAIAAIFLMFGVAGTASAANISLNASDWSLYVGSGVIQQDPNGVMLTGIDYRTGALMQSNQTADLTNADVYIKWMAHGSNAYMGTGVGTGYFTGGSYTTDHSWEGSLVVPQDVWLYSHIDFNLDATFTTNISTGNFDNLGGALLYATSGTITDPSNLDAWHSGRITTGLIDNYGGTASSVLIGEARYNAVPEPASIVLIAAGLIGFARTRRKHHSY